MTHSRAVFLDRDGVLNELVFDKEECRISSPLSSSQIQIFPYVPVTIKKIQEMGFKAIVASNQPGVAKKQFSFSEFVRMKEKFKDRLAKEKCFLDGEYYCLHHPSAVLKKYKVKCECRKPKPGLIIRAALENKIDLKASFFVGDSLVDVKAGKAAGCKTILISHMTDFLNHIMQKENIFPDYLVSSLKEVPAILLGTSKIGGVPTLRHK